MFNFTSTYFLNLLLSLPGIIFAISFHEMAHAYAADAMGDPTPKMAGRLTPNPLKHLDPVGFLCMLLFRFGWAKPVPINPNNFQNRRKGVISVALSGSLTNLLLGFISLVVIYIVTPFANTTLLIILQYMYIYNLFFGIFNLIPIPPLDGSQILVEFLSPSASMKYRQFTRYSMFILMILIFTGLFSVIITPIYSGIDALYRLILDAIFGLFY